MTTSSDIRTIIRQNVMSMCELDPTEAADLEIGILNSSLSWAKTLGFECAWSNPLFCYFYKAKACSILNNLVTDAVGNNTLVQRLKAREFLPHELAFMYPHQMFPDRWKDVMQTKEERDNYIYNQKPEAMTDQFKCKKCHKRECVYYEQQMRSCDEPMSLFITCLTCGHRWRIG